MLTVTDIHHFLMKSIDALRGSVDRLDVVKYVSAILLYKHLSDECDDFEKQYRKAQSQNAEVDDSLFKGFCKSMDHYYIPKESRWKDLWQPYSKLSDSLAKSLHNIEQENPELRNCFSVLERSLQRISRHSLEGILHYFNRVNLSVAGLQSPDVLGKAYELFLQDAVKRLGIKGVDFYTPPAIVDLLMNIASPKTNQTILDPCCGYGGILVAPQRYFSSQNVHADISLIGQDCNFESGIMAKINLVLHGIYGSYIEHEDFLENPLNRNNRELVVYDRVISHPPFHVTLEHMERYEPVLRDFPDIYKYGLSKTADWMFVQQMLASCKDAGKVVTLISTGALTRLTPDQKIRAAIVEDKLVEAVISLPAGVLYGLTIPISILVLTKQRDPDSKDQILFVDAAHDFEQDKHAKYLDESHIEKITQAYFKGANDGSYARLVNLDEVRDKGHSLNVNRYVDNSPARRRIEELHLYQQSFKEYSFTSDIDNPIVVSISGPRETPKPNSVLMSRVPYGKKLCVTHNEVESKKRLNYLEVQFDEEQVLSRYVLLYFESELGRLTLQNLPSGVSMPKLNRANIELLSIFVPDMAQQKEIIKLARKLDVSREQLADYKNELLTKPAQYSDIESKIDGFMYDISSVDEQTRIRHLINQNETQRIEFKQTCFANVDDLGKQLNRKKNRDYKQRCLEVNHKICKNIASFLNADGGTLLIGVEDDGNILGIEHEMQNEGIVKEEVYIKELAQLITNKLGKDCLTWLKFTSVELDDKTIAVVDCQRAQKPVLIPANENSKEHTDLVVRKGTGSDKLTGYQLLNYIDAHFRSPIINTTGSNNQMNINQIDK